MYDQVHKQDSNFIEVQRWTIGKSRPETSRRNAGREKRHPLEGDPVSARERAGGASGLGLSKTRLDETAVERRGAGRR